MNETPATSLLHSIIVIRWLHTGREMEICKMHQTIEVNG